MKPTDLFNDLQNKVSEALRNSPARDIEKNVRSMMTQGFARLDLVTREEFDVQSQVLARTRARLEELEERVAELERRAGIPPGPGAWIPPGAHDATVHSPTLAERPPFHGGLFR